MQLASGPENANMPAQQNLIMPSSWSDNNNTTVGKKLISKEQSSLSERLVEIARKELREDENTRKQCLQQFRDWILKNQDIENCFTNDKFLLRFLRVKKFSIPMAEQTLLKYLNFRKRFSHLMFDMDYLETNTNTLITNGYIFVSPFRDSNGRRVIIYDLSKFDPHKYTNRDMAKAHVVTYETLMDDEENQILGINHVGDLKGASAAFITLWSITEFATVIRWGEQSYPMRHKEMNMLNLPTGLKYVYDFVQSNIKSQKLKERFLIHNSIEDLHKQVNKRCLPLEMGGIMPMNEMVELWKEELAAKRDLLLTYDTMNLLSDKGIICRRNAPAQDDTGVGSLPGSFRKLEVD